MQFPSFKMLIKLKPFMIMIQDAYYLLLDINKHKKEVAQNFDFWQND